MGYPSAYEDIINRAVENAFLARRINPPDELTGAIKAELNEYLVAHQLSLNQAYRETAELKSKLAFACEINDQLRTRADALEVDATRLRAEVKRLQAEARKHQLESSEAKGRAASEHVRARQLSDRLARTQDALSERNQLVAELAACKQELHGLHKLTMERLVGR